jgi:hypothetical protein
MFTPVRARIEDILNSPCQFAIPVYQRDYKWGKDEALELIEDLRNYPATGTDNLFLGNMIFENTCDHKLHVVDGQQRLTTILLLLVACRMRAIALNNYGLAQTILGKITFIDSTTAESKGVRLIASESVRDVFSLITTDSWDGAFPTHIQKKSVKRQSNKLRPIYEYFRGEVDEMDREGLSKFLGAIYNSFVIRIDIESDVDALSLFERTNARGMELEISDLLKNYLFSKKVDAIQESWTEIVDNSGGTILRMLKYFYVSTRGYILKPQLYKKLKGYAAEVGPREMTGSLIQFSQFYKLFKSPTDQLIREYFEKLEITAICDHQPRYQRVLSACEGLAEFGVTQCCPTAHAAIMCLVRNKKNESSTDAKAIMRLFDALERYHFINNAVCERVGNEVERMYADYCLEFEKSNDVVRIVDKLIVDLKSKVASLEEFTVNFAEINYAADKVSFLFYIFDRFNNKGLDPSQWIRIYSPDIRVARRNQNIEHFLPQKPDAQLKVKKETMDVIDNIGNLLAISYRTNSRLGNDAPATKMSRLQGDLRREVQNLPYIDEFISKYSCDAASWDKSKIQKRATDLAKTAYSEVWAIK